ncbi:hypothetical protein PR048_011556 [Dryococelus australis]|uniref:Uncharacterized protein n=1 Tax=Dryococelus australis TaxID=614101 RepID=A0ABQ9HLU5_9NEOP|nr:hypothetical protein PR048_011556 [Dryococelus australis]
MNPDKTSDSHGRRLVKIALDVLHSNPEYVHVKVSEDKGPKRLLTNSHHAKTLANRAIKETAEEPSDVKCDDCDSYIPSSHESSDTDEHSVPDAQSFRTDLSPHHVLKTQSITTGNCSISTTQNGKTPTSPQPSTSMNGNNPPASHTPPKNGHTHSATPQHSPAKKRHISDPSTACTNQTAWKLERNQLDRKSTCRFSENPRYVFHKPKKDLCKRCVAHKEMTSGSSQNYDETPYLKHLERKHAAREHRNEVKEAAKNDSYILAFNFDLQAIFNTPKGAAGPFFYLRKLAVYNLTLYKLRNQDVQCFTWDETEGKWTRQQKNATFANMSLHVVRNHPTIQLINHAFFEHGRNQMECDSIHSKIEQKAKAIPVYTPDRWVQIMRPACANPRPYKVTILLHDDFQDFNNTKE